MGIGLKGSVQSYNRLSQDTTPQHYLSPFQRSDLFARMQSLGDIQRSQAEDAIGRRTRDTSGPAYQQMMGRLNEGTTGSVGTATADVEMKDLEMGEQAKQRRLQHLAKIIQMKQQYKQMQEAQKAASAKPEESASDKFLGKYTLGGKLIKKAGMSPTQVMATAAGAAVGGPMGAQAGSMMGQQANTMQTGGGTGAGGMMDMGAQSQPSSGMEMTGPGMSGGYFPGADAQYGNMINMYGSGMMY